MKLFFLGIIQGLTEFFPVSSSGHLYLLNRIIGQVQTFLPFIVLLHLATLLSICVFLRKEILSFFFTKKIFVHILIISFIAGGLGLLIANHLESYFADKYWISFFLLFNGGILLIRRKAVKNRSVGDIRLKDSIIFGLLQAIAVFPGISRSGITIVGIMQRGFKPNQAFILSFLMAIPAILGAFILEAPELRASGLPFWGVVSGFTAAFLVGLLALKIVKKSLIINRFQNFGYYCIIVSLVSLLA